MQFDFEKLKGVIVPIVTPLNEDETIDAQGTERVIDYIFDGGAHGLFALGTTGEYIRLADKEKDRFVEICASRVNGRGLFSVNVSDIGTKKILRNIAVAQRYRPDFIAVSIPAYFVLNSIDEQYAFYKSVVESTDLPVMIYNIPCCTGGYISTGCIEKMLRHKNVIGIKDSSGNMQYLQQIADIANNERFAIFNGHEGKLFEAFEIGAKGVISSSANVFVKEMTALYNSCITGDTRCRDGYYGFITAYHASKADFNDNIYGIYVLKYLLQRKGLCSANVTMPFFRNVEKDRSIERFCEAFNI